MKNYAQYIKKELRKPSLTVKWALASSFFIFIIFSIFAVITYKSAVDLLVEKEKERLEHITAASIQRLEKNNEDLTLTTTYRSFTQHSINDGSSPVAVEGKMLNIDPFISELGQESLRLYVYNLEHNLVFRTQTMNLALVQTDTNPTIVTIDEVTGYLLAKPVYSQATGKRIGYVQTFYELTAFYEMRNRLLIILVTLEIISLILSCLMCFFLSNYFLKPLKILRDTMNQIRNDPKSDVHMPKIATEDELADLADMFNEMLDRIRSYLEQQEQFVEDVSHELRTPVAIIEGHLSMLSRWGKNDPEILEESLNASVQEISRMKTLVQEMLDLSRAEQVDLHYGNETTNGQEVVHQVLNNFRMLYPDYNFTIDDELAHEEVLKIYRNHFEQILIILLDNAVKYSEDRHEIHVSIEKKEQYVLIAVQDFGEGISEKDISKIFHRFYRVDKARARTKGGNGLGLSIAFKLLKSYKGDIGVESSPGKGSIFRIFVPIAK